MPQVQEKVKTGLVAMNKYIITKQLTKRPEDYPDARNQAHVQVALRRRAAGKRDGVMQVILHLVTCIAHILLGCEMPLERQQSGSARVWVGPSLAGLGSALPVFGYTGSLLA